ncbi:MAG: hypothetical protein ACR2O4_07515 [Hyphomicrobiaceae bacterium]
MKALVTSAFAVTLLISAFTVYYALRSDTLDGEPWALIDVTHPKIADRSPASNPSIVTVKPTSTAAPASGLKTGPATTSTQSVVAKVSATVEPSGSPALAETDATQNKVPKPVAAEAKGSRRPDAGIAILPAETGYGLGVGNLGPISKKAADN